MSHANGIMMTYNTSNNDEPYVMMILQIMSCC